jgi:hypothetical protein
MDLKVDRKSLSSTDANETSSRNRYRHPFQRILVFFSSTTSHGVVLVDRDLVIATKDASLDVTELCRGSFSLPGLLMSTSVDGHDGYAMSAHVPQSRTRDAMPIRRLRTCRC